MSSNFSAAAPTLGYLYQVRYALYLILQERDEEVELSIEHLDDVAFEQDGSARELLQLKHHLSRTASLTDSSPDLWKTIKIWSIEADFERLQKSELVLTLVTTAQAREGSIASLLTSASNLRNPDVALSKLMQVAKESTNESLKSAFEAFMALDFSNQKALVKSIFILDKSVHIEELTEKIMRLLLPIRREHRQSAFEQLESWWFSKAIRYLIDNAPQNLLSREEVEYKLADIADQYGPDALPIHFRDEDPDIPANVDDRMFVEQLRQVGASRRRIEQAILDYYRAFEQRSRWARQELLLDDEVTMYEKRLVEEWEILSFSFEDLEVDADEEKKKQLGLKILNHIYTNLDIPIRRKVTEPYVMRGSYHILADNLKGPKPQVWWHPNFVERLDQVLSMAVG